MRLHKFIVFCLSICFMAFAFSCGSRHVITANPGILKQYRKVAVVPIEIKVDSVSSTGHNISIGIQSFISEKLKSGTSLDLKLGQEKSAKEKVKHFQDFLAESINRNLLAKGFIPIERGRINTIITEIGLQQTGLFSSKNADRIGKLARADALFLGKLLIKEQKGLFDDDVTYTFSGRLVSVQDGMILISGELTRKSSEEEITLSEIRGLIEDWFNPVNELD